MVEVQAVVIAVVALLSKPVVAVEPLVAVEAVVAGVEVVAEEMLSLVAGIQFRNAHHSLRSQYPSCSRCSRSRRHRHHNIHLRCIRGCQSTCLCIGSQAEMVREVVALEAGRGRWMGNAHHSLHSRYPTCNRCSQSLGRHHRNMRPRWTQGCHRIRLSIRSPADMMEVQMAAGVATTAGRMGMGSGGMVVARAAEGAAEEVQAQVRVAREEVVEELVWEDTEVAGAAVQVLTAAMSSQDSLRIQYKCIS